MHSEPSDPPRGSQTGYARPAPTKYQPKALTYQLENGAYRACAPAWLPDFACISPSVPEGYPLVVSPKTCGLLHKTSMQGDGACPHGLQRPFPSPIKSLLPAPALALGVKDILCDLLLIFICQFQKLASIFIFSFILFCNAHDPAENSRNRPILQ